MKQKAYTIENGTVRELTHFELGMFTPQIHASTKAEATAKFLNAYAEMSKAGSPVLWVKNGAYCLAVHNGEGWTAESGTTHERRARLNGSLFPLCCGGIYDTPEQARKACSFDYYASDEFKHEEAAQYAESVPAVPAV